MPRPTMLALVMALSFNAISSVSAFSAEAENFDIQGFIDQSIVTGAEQITIPPGRYRVTPRNGHHLNLHDLENVRIIADGVEMICTETTRALTIANCRNATVRGLVIDYDPLPFTQGKIVKVSGDKTHRIHEIELFGGYLGAESANAFKYEIFKPDTRTLRCDDRIPERLEVIDQKHLRIFCGYWGVDGMTEQEGDLVVIGATHAPHGVAVHAIVCSGNVNVRLENIDLYASNSFGFLEYDCDGSIYERCRIDRRPAAADIAQRADPRLRSLNADAFHSIQALKGPAYIECSARFMGDDAINIHGNYDMVTECLGAELRILAKGTTVAVGDAIELFAYDGRRLPEAKVVDVKQDGKINDDEKAFLLKQPLHELYRAQWNADAWRITLDRTVELTRGSVIASRGRLGNGFLVQGCDFGYNRSRGIIIKASNGRVVDNRLTENWMSAILVSPEYWWLESGNSDNVEIRGNTIIACQGRAILVTSQGGSGVSTGAAASAGAHNNVAIEENAITDCPLPNIEATSTTGLRIKNNTFRSPRGLASGQVPVSSDAVKTRNCDQVIQENNN